MLKNKNKKDDYLIDYEILLLENKKLKLEIESYKNGHINDFNSTTRDDIEQMVYITMEMKTILQELRNTQINYNIAKRIDTIMDRLEEMDRLD